MEKQATGLQQRHNCIERHNGLSINVLLLKMSPDPIPHHTHTKKLKWITELNVKLKTIKHLRGKKADYLHDPGVESYFLNKTQKH